MNSRILPIVYLLALAAEIFAVATHSRELESAAKPALMPILIVYYLAGTKNSGPIKYAVALALFFSWLGDVVLLLDKVYASLFVLGLVAFLIAHLFYIFYFLRIRRINRVRGRPNLTVLAGTALYTAGLFAALAPHVGAMLYPVAVYAAVIAAMFAACLGAFDFSKHDFGRLCAAGAFLFLISDSILAVNRFAAPFAPAPALVMLTYGLAQLLLTEGSLRNLRETEPAV